MEAKDAEIIWEVWMSHPDMLMQPKKGELLRPSKRPVNFLGSINAYKKKFIKAMADLKEI